MGNKKPFKTKALLHVAAIFKIKVWLHVAAVFIMFILTDSFCHEIIRRAAQICSLGIFLTALYTCLAILNVGIAVFLYAKYVLRTSFSQIYLGKPCLVLRWCIVGIGMPFVADAVSILFTKGTFQVGQHTKEELVSILFYDVFSFGLRTAVTEGMLFRGLLYSILQKEFGKKGGTLASSFFYAATGIIFYNSYAWNGASPVGAFLLTFLMGLAFAAVTCEAGSVWPCVGIHFLYQALCGDAYILHIGIRQDYEYPAIFTYTVERGGIFGAGLPLPSIAVFLALLLMALAAIRKKGK